MLTFAPAPLGNTVTGPGGPVTARYLLEPAHIKLIVKGEYGVARDVLPKNIAIPLVSNIPLSFWFLLLHLLLLLLLLLVSLVHSVPTHSMSPHATAPQAKLADRLHIHPTVDHHSYTLNNW